MGHHQLSLKINNPTTRPKKFPDWQRSSLCIGCCRVAAAALRVRAFPCDFPLPVTPPRINNLPSSSTLPSSPVGSRHLLGRSYNHGKSQGLRLVSDRRPSPDKSYHKLPFASALTAHVVSGLKFVRPNHLASPEPVITP